MLQGAFVVAGQNYILEKGLDHVLRSNIPSMRGSIPPIILDIDLDFFGCDSPYVSMVKAGLSREIMQSIQEHLLSKLQLCAAREEGSRLVLDVAAEARADDLLTKCALFISQHPKAGEREVLQELERQKHLELLQAVTQDANQCRHRLNADRLTVDALKHSLALIVKHSNTRFGGGSMGVSGLQKGFEAMAKYGFCIDTEEFPRRSYKVGVCVGSSDYDDDVNGRIQIHHPTKDETLRAKNVMRHLLDQVSTFMGNGAPVMVTICRSMRDGYTPREILEDVQDSVLRDLDRLLSRAQRTHRVIYDQDLYKG